MRNRADCDAFTRGFLDCAAWLATDGRTGESVEWGPGPADEAVAAVRWLAASVRDAAADCAAFQLDNAEALATAYQAGYSPEQAGHDYFLTRNRHGAGFWDRGLGEAGQRLTDAAHAAGEIYCERFHGLFRLS